jgi:lysine-specific histone demethylase 1
LSAIVAGKAAIEDEQKEIELVEYALTVLRKLYGEKAVPQPTAFRVTKWGIDPFSRGAYSYVTIGASKEDYDVLSLPVQNKVFFAGDATCRDNPNSVGGAILSGIREAVRILEALHGFRDIFSESKIISTSERKLEMEKDGLVNILKNANASTQKLVDDELLKSAASMEEFLASLKSNSRRLSVAQEMLQLPCSSLRKFLGTRDGLLVLKAWIQVMVVS